MGIPTSEVFKRALGELHKRYVRSPEFEQFVMEEAGKVQTGEAPASDATPAMGVEVQAAIEAAPNVVRFLSRDLRPE